MITCNEAADYFILFVLIGILMFMITDKFENCLEIRDLLNCTDHRRVQTKGTR